MKTRKEVENLKQLWLDDQQAFNLAKTEGYEDYREELEAFMAQHSGSGAKDQAEQMKEAFAHLRKSAAFGTLPGALSLQDRIAIELIAEMIKDDPAVRFAKPERLGEHLQAVGYGAYERANYLLKGRMQFLTENCDCPECRKNKSAE